MPKIIVIYHRSDFDGIFCREIAQKFLGTDSVEYVGWEYGDPVPIVAETDFPYVLDLSIDALMGHPNLVWIDHHQSAIAKYWDRLINGYRIDGVAACRLTYQWFETHREKQISSYSELPDKKDYVERHVVEPLAVRLAGEYDVWDKRDPAAELFQHGLRSRKLTNDLWQMLLSIDSEEEIRLGRALVDNLLQSGKSIQFAKQTEDASVINAHGFTIQWEGLSFLCCNHARFNSFLFQAGIRPEHDGLLGFCFNGKEWKFSLYGVPHKPEIDLSLIAKKYGGGGHKGACGFLSKTLPFQLPVKY